MGKRKKPKLSKIKRNNQMKAKLSKQGKLKTARHKLAKKRSQKPAPPRLETAEKEESDDGEDLMDMVEEDDLNFLKKAISNKSYELLRRIRLPESKAESKCESESEKKKNEMEKKRPIEEQYENKLSAIMKGETGKSVRALLPIKTRKGFVQKRVIENNNQNVS